MRDELVSGEGELKLKLQGAAPVHVMPELGRAVRAQRQPRAHGHIWTTKQGLYGCIWARDFPKI